MPSNFIARTIRWSAWEGCEAGLEHAEVSPIEGGLEFSGVIIGHAETLRFGLTYKVKVDGYWRTREAHLQMASGRALHLESNGQGLWRANGTERPELQGCLDVDIQASPITNTLPIRRLSPKAQETIDVRLCYISIPSLDVSPRDQRYTATRAGQLYRFESVDSGFTADLPVDSDGFVLDYPGLFKRLAP
ncbi:putative glycolipid-binding domain-containing protein [Microvirga rosea]|uniref:putative glycolipid-binding domain-containing protein n=1 Tax=Microvirga rosea TaxID=2715425 RepID=UPI001D0A071E|nr:putative glycolipid-binding domain-containing protein [Microvirga rosea]MCB8820488.1 putative glycolipid-binding domain-containing protein [Microvirga rosea]